MDSENENYKYQLVEFVSRGPKSSVKSVDIVPSTWITYNPQKGKLECAFLPPPYDLKKSNLLQKMVMSRSDAPKDWPLYTILVKGGASKYTPSDF